MGSVGGLARGIVDGLEGSCEELSAAVVRAAVEDKFALRSLEGCGLRLNYFAYYILLLVARCNSNRQ